MWKKSKVWKNRKFQILIFLEVCLLCVGLAGVLKGDTAVCDQSGMNVEIHGGEILKGTGEYFVDGSSGVRGEWLVAEGFSLKPGSYDVVLHYDAADNGSSVINVKGENVPFNSLLSNAVTIYSGVESCKFQFYALDWLESTNVKIIIEYYGQQALRVKGIELIRTTDGDKAFAVSVFAISMLVDFLVMLYVYMGEHSIPIEKKVVWFGVPALALLSSFPVFVDYMITGADSIFHILRIEFLADTLVKGVFPVRIEPDWIFGHGYANSIFYCDTFLVLPALLRILGFPIVVAYGAFVFAVNLATAWIAYVSFKRIFRDEYIGIFGSLLYTLAPYRVYNIYNRTAVGEYTAMTFLPLVCLGFYLLLGEDVKKKEYKNYWIILMLGVSGIIQSHVLSCEIVVVFAAFVCLILLKRVFRKETFAQLVKAVVGTVLLNLWYLVPFLDMMMSGKYKYSQNQDVFIQQRGIVPANILDIMQSAGGNSRFHELGLVDTEPINAGVALLIGVLMYLWLRKEHKEKESVLDGIGMIAFVIGVAAIVFSTCFFPWDTIQTWNGFTAALVPMIQFPTRLTLVPTVCFTVVACVAAIWILKGADKRKKIIFFGVVVGCSVFFSMYQTNDVLDKKGNFVRLHSVEGAGHSGVLGAEYIPLEGDLCYEYHEPWLSGEVQIGDYEKEDLDIRFNVAVSPDEKDAWVELPMIYYKGYRAIAVDTDEELNVEMGTSGHVRVYLDAGYEGSVHAWYAGMWYWHIAEMISGLFAVAMIALYMRHVYQVKRNVSR